MFMFLEKYPSLKSRDFRLWAAGQFISNIGTQMQFVAINWQIYIITHSPFALGVVGFIRFFPIIIFSFIAGSVADNFNRKIANLISQIALTILSLILAICTYTHKETSFLIYIITFLTAIGVAFESPTRQALIPSLVKKKELGNAINLTNVLRETGTIIGPAIAGFLIAYIGIGNIYLINALSFLVIIFALLMMNASGDIVGNVSGISLSSILEGIVFIKSKTILWSTILLDFFCTFFSGATALLPIFAKDILSIGPQGLGFLYAAPSVGAVLAAFILAHIGKISKEGKVLLIGVLIYSVGTIIFGMSKNFWLSLIALVIVGAGDSFSTIIRSTIRQLVTPDYLRGRMVSITMLFYLGGPQLGDFEAGTLANFIGAPYSVISGGLATLLVIGLFAFKIPELKNYEGHKE